VKRFYKEVEVTADLGIALDGRLVKTPARAALILPNVALAAALAEEWKGQGEEIDPRSMPLTGLSNAAIDRADPDMAATLARYVETELLCYRAEEPFDLVARQNQDWNPVLGWAQQNYGVEFTLARGIMHVPQPAETLAKFADIMSGFDRFTLAALNPLVTIAGSLVIALAVEDGAMEADAAFNIAHLDELWQIEQWGEDDLARQMREAHRADFLNAARFLALL
jgi:chaperone required for assembly of F1-ATPase